MSEQRPRRGKALWSLDSLLSPFRKLDLNPQSFEGDNGLDVSRRQHPFQPGPSKSSRSEGNPSKQSTERELLPNTKIYELDLEESDLKQQHVQKMLELGRFRPAFNERGDVLCSHCSDLGKEAFRKHATVKCSLHLGTGRGCKSCLMLWGAIRYSNSIWKNYTTSNSMDAYVTASGLDGLNLTFDTLKLGIFSKPGKFILVLLKTPLSCVKYPREPFVFVTIIQ